MITKEQAVALRYREELHYKTCHKHVGPRGGIYVAIQRVRVNGVCKTWKRAPEQFRVPVKYGMYECFDITEKNACDWHLASECPLLCDNA